MKLDSRLTLGLGLSSSNIRTVVNIAEATSERQRVAKVLHEIKAQQSVRMSSLLAKDPDPMVRCSQRLERIQFDMRSANSHEEAMQFDVRTSTAP